MKTTRRVIPVRGFKSHPLRQKYQGDGARLNYLNGLMAPACFSGRGFIYASAERGLAQVEYLMVALGGMVGAVARYAVSGWVSRINGTEFPYGTLVVNLLGSFLLGLLATLLIERLAVDPLWRVLITIGLLGSFTTFSSVTFESLKLMETGMFDAALLNVFGSTVCGLVAAWAGVVIARGF